MASPERLSVPDTELSRPALVLAQRFVQWWDLHARQLDDGSYIYSENNPAPRGPQSALSGRPTVVHARPLESRVVLTEAARR